MINKAIYVVILKSIREVENLSIQELDDFIEVEDILPALELVQKKLNKTISIEFVSRLIVDFKTVMLEFDLDMECLLIGTPHVIDFSKAKFKGVKRNFFNNDGGVEFLAVSFYPLSKQDTKINIAVLDFIIKFLKVKAITDQNVDEVLKYIFDENANIGFLISDHSSTNIERLYIFSYLAAMNSGKNILLDPEFEYNSYKIAHSLPFNPKFQYRQYVEVYDIFNELILAKDVLTRFLKVYHILEYLSYRMVLKKMVKGSKSRSFYQSMKKFPKEVGIEKEFIPKYLTILLKTDKNIIENSFMAKINSANEKLMKDEFEFTVPSKWSLRLICDFIYSIRCSIVHNKESETHLNLATFSKYSALTPLLRELIKVLEERLVVILSSDDAEIKYSSINMRMIK